MSILDLKYYGNTLQDWLIAFGIAVIVFFAAQILKRILIKRLSILAPRTTNQIDELIVDMLRRTKIFFVLILSIYVGAQFLTLPKTLIRVFDDAAIIAVLIQVALWGNQLIVFLIRKYIKVKEEEEDISAKATITALGFVSKLLLWSVVILLILENLGVDITTLVAGLGIGGIAVALALQNVLGDLFASLSIMIDKPFVIGDIITVDTFFGTVEHIGLKTTRVRSLSGEQLIFSNNDLLRSRIRNFKRMQERRILFIIGVTYQTPYEKIRIIPEMLKEIIEAQELTRFDRAHFKEYGSSSLNFEAVYYVLDQEYITYMNIQEKINFSLCRRFAEENIEFAYPTQTVFLEKVNSEMNKGSGVRG